MARTLNYEKVQEYILDNNLTENDTILLHPYDYEEVANEFFEEHNLFMYRPVEILGVSITEDTTGTAKKHTIYVLEQLVAS